LITFWEYQEPLNKIIKNKTNANDKMLAIYDYIRKNIKWNKEYNRDVNPVHGKFISKMYTKVTKKLIKEKSLSEPFNENEGSSSEINFILIYLLNKAGIEANPVLISTRDNGKADMNIPEAKQFNHVLALAKIENEQFLLDATDSLRPYHILDANDLNTVGFYLHAKDFKWIPINNNIISETSTYEKINLDSNLVLVRETLIQETGYDALNHRKEISKYGKDNFISNYKTEHLNTMEEEKIEIKNIEDDFNPLVFNISQSKKIEEDKEFIFHVKFNPVYKPEDFADSFRQLPIDFIYPLKKTYLLETDIPDDYVIEYPRNETYSTYGDNASFKYTVIKGQNKIQLQIELLILKSEFPALEYNNLAELFTKIDEKLKENIVIKRAK
jgi:hypothetical protein